MELTNDQLFNLLTKLSYVRSYRWDIVCKVVELIDTIDTTKAVVISKRWEDKWKQDNPQYNPLDLSKIKTWSTYENCVTLEFRASPEDGRIILDALIYDGENMHGHATGLRFEAKISLYKDFIVELKDVIGWKLDSLTEDLHDEHLESKRKQWIAKAKSDIIKSITE
jgi:hypothetical protein